MVAGVVFGDLTMNKVRLRRIFSLLALEMVLTCQRLSK